MASLAPSVPHLAIPVRISAGRFDMVEQDSADDILQCATAIASTPRGALVHAPDFGVTEQTFAQQPLDAEKVARELGQQEPRAAYLAATNVEAHQRLVADVLVTVRSHAS